MHKPEELNGKTIESAKLGQNDGDFSLTFTDGTILVVRPGWEYSLNLTLKEAKV
jgi:hypothetical protein